MNNKGAVIDDEKVKLVVNTSTIQGNKKRQKYADYCNTGPGRRRWIGAQKLEDEKEMVVQATKGYRSAD
ncbi:50S ribosomal protein L13 domain protein [Necator americanus]|uniref:50S ribosomal protein L13 domain protein n=1 Tax=Necator americanus TaxID=51031 RepID=W2TB41_NECAM|nr:50S ribosomal protein L13 domain protein [Necator americanus]ETN78232.1 50S ribosomal protein L13 domain protein [Necator americanus]